MVLRQAGDATTAKTYSQAVSYSWYLSPYHLVSPVLNLLGIKLNLGSNQTKLSGSCSGQLSDT